jgi:hypothetical protein
MAYLIALKAIFGIAAVVLMIPEAVHTFNCLGRQGAVLNAVSFLSTAKALSKSDLVVLS